MTTNINGSQDEYYRYKRPLITVKQTVNFTEITNLEDVCRALGRTSKLLMAYLQIKLATQAKKNTLRGQFSTVELESQVRDFTKLLILCGKCSNPETLIKTKRDITYLKCESCGSRTEVVLTGSLDKLSRQIE
jgi:translation initiation factor 2 beta subunit (eIF-2beta)/eIF-5